MKHLLYVTGAAAASLTELNIMVFHGLRPDDEIRVVLTRTARTFVAPRALSADTIVYEDSWDDGEALHLELASWPDVIIVHPATLNFLSRVRGGAADTPMMLALQCTKAPIVICPSIPPGAENSPGYTDMVDYAAKHDRYHLIDTTPGYSMALHTQSGRAPHAFSEVLDLCRDIVVSDPAIR